MMHTEDTLLQKLPKLMAQFVSSPAPAPLAFLQVQVEILGNPVKFGQPSFGKAPEALNPVYVFAAVCKLILPVIDAQML